MSKLSVLWSKFAVTKVKVGIFLALTGIIVATSFQNCAKGKFNLSPEQINLLAQKYCQGGVTTSCENETGTGVQCSVPLEEVAAGVCVFENCKSGYNLQGNLCVPNTCEPSTVASCTYTVNDYLRGLSKTNTISNISTRTSEFVPLGSGTMVCNSQGSGYGTCNPIICPNPETIAVKMGFAGASANVSEPSPTISSSPTSSPSPTATPSPTPTFSPSPSPTPSPSGYIVEECKYACDTGESLCAQFEMYAYGYEFESVCTEDNQYFAGCRAVSCKEGYINPNASPSPSPTASPTASPTVSPTSSPSPTPSPTESPLTKAAQAALGIKLPLIEGEVYCLQVICNPGETQSCTDGVGTGTQTCNSIGTANGACQITSCAEGFELNNGVCEAKYSCVPYEVQGGETPVACTVPNGTGVSRCNAYGNGYTCMPTTCDEGYNSAYTSECVPNICTPNTIESCTVGNGNGNRTCYFGALYGMCTLVSCNPPYTLDPASNRCNFCEPGSINTCESGVPHARATEICNDDGQSKSECTVRGCESGYALTNGICYEL